MRTVITAVASAALVSVLLPVGAQAAGTLMTIVDDDTSSKAQVVNGRLSVGDGSGRLTTEGHTDRLLVIDGAPPVDSTTVSVANYDRVRIYVKNGDTDALDFWIYSNTVPDGPDVPLQYFRLEAGQSKHVIHDVPGTSLDIVHESMDYSTAAGIQVVIWGRS